MTTLNLKDFPEELMERLKARAREQHRSVRGEVIHILETVLDAESADPRPVLDRVEEIRRAYRPTEPGKSTDELLAEDRGR